MQFNRKQLFTSPHMAEEAFYRALANKDLPALMSTWADEEMIVCILPTGQRLRGYQAIQSTFAEIFQRSPAFEVRVNVQHTQQGVMMAMHHVVETIRLGEAPEAPIFAVNIYMRTPEGWRLYYRQLTPVHSHQLKAVTQPTSDAETISQAPTLH